MSDLHSGIPHDLPEYEPNDPPRDPRRRVRVFKEAGLWRWAHDCKQGPLGGGSPYWLQAMWNANYHARRCP